MADASNANLVERGSGAERRVIVSGTMIGNVKRSDLGTAVGKREMPDLKIKAVDGSALPLGLYDLYPDGVDTPVQVENLGLDQWALQAA